MINRIGFAQKRTHPKARIGKLFNLAIKKPEYFDSAIKRMVKPFKGTIPKMDRAIGALILIAMRPRTNAAELLSKKDYKKAAEFLALLPLEDAETLLFMMPSQKSGPILGEMREQAVKLLNNMLRFEHSLLTEEALLDKYSSMFGAMWPRKAAYIFAKNVSGAAERILANMPNQKKAEEIRMEMERI